MLKLKKKFRRQKVKQDFDLNETETVGTHLQRVFSILNVKINAIKYFSKAGKLILFAKHIDSSISTDSSLNFVIPFCFVTYECNLRFNLYTI